MVGLSKWVLALNIYLKSRSTSGETRIYHPSLKMLEVKSLSCTTPVNIFLLLCLIFTRVRSNQSINVIYWLELCNFHRIRKRLWIDEVMNYFPPNKVFPAVASHLLLYWYFHDKWSDKSHYLVPPVWNFTDMPGTLRRIISIPFIFLYQEEISIRSIYFEEPIISLTNYREDSSPITIILTTSKHQFIFPTHLHKLHFLPTSSYARTT